LPDDGFLVVVLSAKQRIRYDVRAYRSLLGHDAYSKHR
jgi:hypothetical protein